MSPPDGAERVRRIIDEAEDVQPEPPRPLMRELPPADPYPVEALGGVLGAAAKTGLACEVRIPPDPGADWLEVLNAQVQP